MKRSDRDFLQGRSRDPFPSFQVLYYEYSYLFCLFKGQGTRRLRYICAAITGKTTSKADSASRYERGAELSRTKPTFMMKLATSTVLAISRIGVVCAWMGRQVVEDVGRVEDRDIEAALSTKGG